MEPSLDWRDQGVKVISGDHLDTNTGQTTGMSRAAAITHARTGASKLWAGTVTIHPDASIRDTASFICGVTSIADCTCI